MTIARAIEWLLESNQLDQFGAIRAGKIRDLLNPDRLQPWHKVRWAFLLEPCRDRLADFVVPTGPDAIAAYLDNAWWRSQAETFNTQWQDRTRSWRCDPLLSRAIACLSEWQDETEFYADAAATLDKGTSLKDSEIQIAYGALLGDRDLLDLAGIPLPPQSQALAIQRDYKDNTPITIDLVEGLAQVAFPLTQPMLTKMRELAQSIGVQRSFHKPTRTCRFPPEHLPAIVAALPGAIVSTDFQSVKAPDEVNPAVAALSRKLDDGKILFDHQWEGAQAMVKQSMIVADDMGTGKTIMSLSAAKAHWVASGVLVLVLAPVSLLENWKIEARMVGVPIKVYSWDSAPKTPPDEPFVLIADEAHYAKGGTTTERGTRFLRLSASPNCVAVWPVTGTPMKNGWPIEMLPLLKAIKHPIAQDVRHYELRYCDAKVKTYRNRRTWDNKGARNLDELRQKTCDRVLLNKKEDCTDLPPKTRLFRKVQPSKSALDLFNATLDRLKAEHHARIESGEIAGDPTAEALVELGQLRQASSFAKIEAAIEIAEEVISQGKPIVLFTDFAVSGAYLADQLRSRGFRVDFLSGETKPKERQAIKERFQAGETDVFVGTILAGGVGLTLTRASTVVLVDRPWSPEDARQAEDRCHRIGTTSNVFALWLQFGPIDERVDNLLAQKTDRINLVLQGKRKTMRGIKTPKAIARELASDIFGS